MNPIESYKSVQLNDGRKSALFKAICDANRRGYTKQRVEQELITKAVYLDGLTATIAREKMDDVYSRYAHEHGVSGGKIRGTMVETLDDPQPIIQWDWQPVPMPVVTLTPQEQARCFFEAVFKPGDIIAIDHKPTVDWATQKANPTIPKTRFRYDDAMAKWDEYVPELFAYDDLANGAFVIINPVNDSMGAKTSDDVTDYRYVLIECDHLSLELQIAFYKAMNLPLVAVVYSGGKSIHGIMKIEAGRNWKLYEERVKFAFDIIERALVKNDTNCKNANRWTRLPGFRRKDATSKGNPVKLQTLLGTHWGAESFVEWEKEIIEKENKISSVVDFTRLIELPELKPEIVEGIMRQGQKMLVSAPSKKGKSLLQIQMALALSAGNKWLGFQCRRTKTLYCSLEGDSAETIKRVANIADAMGIRDRANYPLVLSLDQARTDLETLAKKIIPTVSEFQAGAVFIDPIYTLLGDEISSAEVKRLTKAISIIGQHTGAAVIFCHHSNKGISTSNQGNHTDQISGSGVFSRFPDALVTFNHNAEGKGKMLFTLRSFETPAPVSITFKYPLFSLSDEPSNTLIGAENPTPVSRGRKSKYTEADYREYLASHPSATGPDFAEHFDISVSLAYEKLKQCRLTDVQPAVAEIELEGI